MDRRKALKALGAAMVVAAAPLPAVAEDGPRAEIERAVKRLLMHWDGLEGRYQDYAHAMILNISDFVTLSGDYAKYRR